MEELMDNIKIEFRDIDGTSYENIFEKVAGEIADCHKAIHDKTGRGKEYLGWLEKPRDYDKEEFNRVSLAAKKIIDDSEVLLVIGIGGSYLGARAVIEALSNNFYNQVNPVQIYFIGHNMSSAYISDLLELIKTKSISVNVISKSGTTTEPALAFRLVKQMMEDKYGKDAPSRIYVTTDEKRGILKMLADSQGYECFVIPDDVGGRYSVLTPVGLLPIAVAGIGIDELMRGAYDGMAEYGSTDFINNVCYKYVACRNVQYRSGKKVEVLVNYEPNMTYFGQWWEQLYGESEGKDGKGLFPTSVNFTTDLHSLGQFIQEGSPILFETVIDIVEPRISLVIPEIPDANDGLDYLEGEELQYVNQKAMEGTIEAHNKGNVANIIISIPKMNEYYMGKLIYMFEKACGVSGYMLGVNPFNQPGVEEYKTSMFRLLGKPGF
jgi:glucose-6-phosphate isomerase